MTVPLHRAGRWPGRRCSPRHLPRHPAEQVDLLPPATRRLVGRRRHRDRGPAWPSENTRRAVRLAAGAALARAIDGLLVGGFLLAGGLLSFGLYLTLQ